MPASESLPPSPSYLIAHSDGTALRIQVQPRASRTEVVGPLGDALKIRVTGPPVEGRANAELTALLAKCLRIPQSSLTLTAGVTGRRKTVVIHGRTPGEVEHALNAGRS